MIKIPEQVSANYHLFSDKLSGALVSNISTFKGKNHLVESYARIAAINAIKVDLVAPTFPEGAAKFFFEAHNDALLSHVNASFGSWRPALQALRSFMENVLASIYYLDHPVEHEKWKAGAFVISPKELREYVSDHPRLSVIASEVSLKSSLDKEYATLSKAVHGASELFRMTSDDGKTNIADPSISELGKWSARERNVVDICITSLIAVMGVHLEGAKMQNLRSALGIAIQSKNKTALKKISIMIS